ncbi:hypothetical protein K402DRAFT_396920 [Aulographum hederae CBS 113979]|uniref:Uncharacterized protein n=1 Tax=Aulographum hederae CBS 113979 TaxID=1176131 RepID=A0A6G1GR37_9PEZI|nr:hypothetical protein K402DRAFT_396920 [Aulographum hederae CBS 113979]
MDGPRSHEEQLTHSLSSNSSSSSDSSTHSLRFPTVHANQSIASLASADINMKRPAAQSPSTLEASTFELLSDSVFLNSDDEDGNTASLASTTDDGHDVHSLADTDEFTEGQNDEQLDSNKPLQDKNGGPSRDDLLQQSIHSVLMSPVDSGTTIRPGSQPYDSTVRFAEEEIKADRMDGTVVHGKWDEPNMAEDFRVYNMTHITYATKQTMSKRCLSLKKPFHVLVLGDSPDWVREDITSKIGNALAVSQDRANGSSRHTVIPISAFGTDGVPDTQVIPTSGVDLELTVCTAVKVEDEKSGKGIKLELDNQLNVYVDTKRREIKADDKGGPSLGLPDLAVFINPSRDDADPHFHAQEALLKCNVPSLSVADARYFNPPPIRAKSVSFLREPYLRTVVLGADDSASQLEVVDTFPLELEAFQELEATQLNRHLAYITRASKSSGSTMLTSVNEQAKRTLGCIKDSYANRKALFKNCRNLPINRHQILYFMVFMLLASPLTMLAARYGNLATQRIGSVETHTTCTPAARVSSTSTAMSVSTRSVTKYITIPSILAPPPPAAPKQVHAEKSLSLPHKAVPTNESHIFEAHKIGDNHFVLTPPALFARQKKPPKLSVQVTRGSEVLKTSMKKLSEGAYVIELEREQAYGVVNITLQTKSKPPFSQKLAVNFGSPWLKLSAWLSTAEKMSKSTQENLHFSQKCVTKYASDLQQVALELSKRAVSVPKSACNVTAVSIHRALNFTGQAVKLVDRVGAWPGQQLKRVAKESSDVVDQSKKQVAIIYDTIKSVDPIGTVAGAPKKILKRAHRNSKLLVKKLKGGKKASILENEQKKKSKNGGIGARKASTAKSKVKVANR